MREKLKDWAGLARALASIAAWTARHPTLALAALAEASLQWEWERLQQEALGRCEEGDEPVIVVRAVDVARGFGPGVGATRPVKPWSVN